MTYKFKEGDRVHFKGNCYSEEDYGIVVKYRGSCYTTGSYLEEAIWVKWDSDGGVQYIREESIELVENDTKEQEAVMLLLSLGYTVSKNS